VSIGRIMNIIIGKRRESFDIVGGTVAKIYNGI
jgi:hypothetical protein